MIMKGTDRLASASLFCLFSLGLVLSGCGSVAVSGYVTRGRPQLLFGNPQIALADFQRAAELDPNYRYDFSILSEGIWSYVGRAYYETGNMAEAKKALEKDLSLYSDDNLSRLYLGMVLIREGNDKRGLQELQTALKSLGEWLDYIHQYNPDGPWWDPGGVLSSEIQSELAMISNKETPLTALLSRAESLGKSFEEEIDRVKRDKDMAVDMAT
jgi:tetratricopeptide (TPR) repeat protein